MSAGGEEHCFLYGSGTNARYWDEWCARKGFDPAGVMPIGPALLPDMELAFRYWSGSWSGGALDVTVSVGSAVEGLLCRVTSQGWAALDVKEGVAGRYYERRRRWIVRPPGRAIAADVYEVCEERRTEFVAPAPDYLDVCRAGFAAWDLGTGQLEAAACNSSGGILPLLFAYGTLLDGEDNHSLLAKLTEGPGQDASVQGALFDLGPYPAMTLDGDGPVEGQVFHLRNPCSALRALDELEGAHAGGVPGGLYRRTVLSVNLAGGAARCWAYVMDGQPEGTLLPAGSWRRRKT